MLLRRQSKADGLFGVNDGVDAVQGADVEYIGMGHHRIATILQAGAVRRFTVTLVSMDTALGSIRCSFSGLPSPLRTT